MGQCEGKAKYTGERCRSRAITGRRFCKMHGGKVPHGAEHHWYRHGRYTTAVPDRMRNDVARLTEDKELLELNQELALLKARLLDVLKRVDTGESGQAWRDARAALRAHGKAMRSGDLLTAEEALRELNTIVLGGMRDWETWNDVRSVIRDVTRVAESQRKYMLEQQHMISVDAAFTLLDMLVETVRRTVPDERVRDLVATEFERIASGTSRREVAVAPPEFAA